MLTKDDYHYGAVEALDAYADSVTEMSAADVIRALESAGYKVVGPEPTEAMVEAAAKAVWERADDEIGWEASKAMPSVAGPIQWGIDDAKASFQASHAATPTLTEPKP